MGEAEGRERGPGAEETSVFTDMVITAITYPKES